MEELRWIEQLQINWFAQIFDAIVQKLKVNSKIYAWEIKIILTVCKAQDLVMVVSTIREDWKRQTCLGF